MTDFDHKLMEKLVTESPLNTLNCQIKSIPPKNQHQTGFVEQHWCTLVRMDRSWIGSSLLASDKMGISNSHSYRQLYLPPPRYRVLTPFASQFSWNTCKYNLAAETNTVWSKTITMTLGHKVTIFLKQCGLEPTPNGMHLWCSDLFRFRFVQILISNNVCTWIYYNN